MTNCVSEELHYAQQYTGDFSLCHDKCDAYLPSLLSLIYVDFNPLEVSLHLAYGY